MGGQGNLRVHGSHNDPASLDSLLAKPAVPADYGERWQRMCLRRGRRSHGVHGTAQRRRDQQVGLAAELERLNALCQGIQLIPVGPTVNSSGSSTNTTLQTHKDERYLPRALNCASKISGSPTHRKENGGLSDPSRQSLNSE